MRKWPHFLIQFWRDPERVSYGDCEILRFKARTEGEAKRKLFARVGNKARIGFCRKIKSYRDMCLDRIRQFGAARHGGGNKLRAARDVVSSYHSHIKGHEKYKSWILPKES